MWDYERWVWGAEGESWRWINGVRREIRMSLQWGPPSPDSSWIDLKWNLLPDLIVNWALSSFRCPGCLEAPFFASWVINKPLFFNIMMALHLWWQWNREKGRKTRKLPEDDSLGAENRDLGICCWGEGTMIQRPFWWALGGWQAGSNA